MVEPHHHHYIDLFHSKEFVTYFSYDLHEDFLTCCSWVTLNENGIFRDGEIYLEY